MLSEWDLGSEGGCTITVDLLICNTRNEETDHEKQSRLPTVEAFRSSVLLRDFK
jgi:hypothetical protein